ncbi:subtilisin-like protease 3 [[Candida] railenensis]|uniref:Subtilisin-like protease 3 n=1 Tax=[Candida] railenensis TaxID=45579 RepID=A0A9P0VXH2_9ASCO|nr:subtilisin-like protease 3 [[Candida] railenensis]
MLLTKSVALAILAAMGAQALVIPEAGVIDVFGKSKAGKAIAVGAEAVAGSVDALTGAASDKVSAQFFQSGRKLIPHKYIVVLKDNVSNEQVSFHKEIVAAKHSEHLSASSEVPETFVAATKDTAGGILDSFNIDNLLNGYTGYFLEETLEFIRNDPSVAFIEQDSTVYASEFQVQKGAPWGLARVSHRQPLSLNSFNQYLFDNKGGKGVTSYIIDTGINVDHVEFGGRAKWGSTIPYGDADADGNGHGTHCAGTIGSEAYGIAKEADLVAVKVLRSNGSGSMSDVVKGVEFAAKSHQQAVKDNKKGFKGSTANMSLGGGKSPALDLAVNAAVKAGLNFAVAAGNENQDACNTSPAAAENAITVGASTIADARAYFSNYGKCVDIFAPGLNVLSTYIGSDSATATLSGTSMASPHIAGLLSYFVSLQPGAESEFFVAANGVSPAQLKKNLIAYASEDLLTDVPDDGTPNLLAFNGAGHNLTGFWSGKEVLEGESKVASGSVSLEEKVESMISKVEHDSIEIFEDLKKLVGEAYKGL